MLSKLLLLSGQDLPFLGGRINVHQPRLKDIALISQNTFYLGSNFLCFSKDKLETEDKVNLKNQTNFDILMSIINNTAEAVQQSVTAAKLVLTLLFPDYQLKVLPNLLLFTRVLQDGTKDQGMINNDNFEEFKEIIKQMFCLQHTTQSDYNPANKKAEEIAKKLRHKRQLMQKKNKGNEAIEINILYQYVSILTLGNHHTIPELMEYTVYQIFNLFNKFEKKYNYDIWLKAKLAGAENLEDVENWMSSDDEKPKEKRPTPKRIEF